MDVDQKLRLDVKGLSTAKKKSKDGFVKKWFFLAVGEDASPMKGCFCRKWFLVAVTHEVMVA